VVTRQKTPHPHGMHIGKADEYNEKDGYCYRKAEFTYVNATIPGFPRTD
jgi:hypothetical protein